jgi:hypothetical protein
MLDMAKIVYETACRYSETTKHFFGLNQSVIYER